MTIGINNSCSQNEGVHGRKNSSNRKISVVECLFWIFFAACEWPSFTISFCHISKQKDHWQLRLSWWKKRKNYKIYLSFFTTNAFSRSYQWMDHSKWGITWKPLHYSVLYWSFCLAPTCLAANLMLKIVYFFFQ